MSRNRRLLIVLGLWALLCLFFLAWLILKWGGASTTHAFDDIGQSVVAYVGAAGCAYAAWRYRGRGRAAWALIATSAFAWGSGEVAWSYYELIAGQQVPFPSFADLGYLLAVPFAIAGVLTFPSAFSRATSMARTALDGLLIAGSLFIISWSTTLGAVYRGKSGHLLADLIGLAYPVGDVVIGTMVIILASRATRSARVPLLLLAGGLFANLSADSAFAYLTATNQYFAGDLVDIGWWAGYLLIGVAGLSAAWAASDAGETRSTSSGWWSLVLPYAPMLAASVVAAAEEATGGLDPIVFWALLGAVGLVVLRQFLTLSDNLSLNHQLAANAQALAKGREHFRSLVQNSSDIITLIAADTTIQFQSGSVERILGYTDAVLIGTSFGELVHPDDRTMVMRKIEESINIPGPPIALECRLRRLDDSYCPAEVTISNLLELPSVRGLVLNMRDISERKALEEKLMHQAFHDSLTNLPNRAAFRMNLDHALTLEGERRIAVLFLDLDDFKAINDTLGHSVGDQLLAAVGARIASTLRPGDSVARLGGDEFAVLLQNMEDERTASHVAARIINRLGSPFAIAGQEISIHASIGIAGLVSGQEAAEELVKNADVAMYIAKARGKGRFVEYEASLARAALEGMELEREIELGMAQNQFVVHYQPVIALETGAIHSVEALVRWNHPHRGLLYPVDFIPVAEQSGLIIELGRWVLQQATREARRWQVRYPSVPALLISVNLSARQLQRPELVEDVMAALDAAGLDPQSLILELTESALLSEVGTIAERLKVLRDRGVRLALDDFGTGYSSLGHLRDFPVDIVKLDRSFVGGIGSSAADGAILRAMIGLAGSLGLMSIAEGIERAEQLAALNAMGCQAGQGFFISKPLEHDAVDALLASCIQAGTGRQLPPAWRLSA